MIGNQIAESWVLIVVCMCFIEQTLDERFVAYRESGEVVLFNLVARSTVLASAEALTPTFGGPRPWCVGQAIVQGDEGR